MLLDTHVWIWAALGGPERLCDEAASALEHAASTGQLVVSAISLWEVAMLESKGRIQLPMDCLAWIRGATRHPGLRVLPISAEIAVASTRLPGELRGDPADRLIAASARHEGALLLTRDRLLLDWGARGHARVSMA